MENKIFYLHVHMTYHFFKCLNFNFNFHVLQLPSLSACSDGQFVLGNFEGDVRYFWMIYILQLTSNNYFVRVNFAELAELRNFGRICRHSKLFETFY